MDLSSENDTGQTTISLDSLLRGEPHDLSRYLVLVEKDVNIDTTRAKLHCHILTLDGNQRPCDEDLAAFTVQFAIEYCIPRKRIAEAKDYLEKTGSPAKFGDLMLEAQGLFTSAENTGEPGELLLYLLADRFLRIPQILCKMPLKTDSEMHFHGADGIHAAVDEAGKLALYWGESKVHKSLSGALTDALDSIKEFLITIPATAEPKKRELQLVRDNLNIEDENLANALLNYFDKDHTDYNKVEQRAVCLIGFDWDKYPSVPNSGFTEDQIRSEALKTITKWTESVSGKINERTPLETFQVHLLMVPMSSVERFRESFQKAIGK